MVAAMNSQATFTSISASGNAVWLAGESVRQYQVSTNGAIRMGPRSASSGKTFESAAVTTAMERIARRARGTHVLEQDLASVAARSLDAELVLRTALPPATDPMFSASLSYVRPHHQQRRLGDEPAGATTSGGGPHDPRRHDGRRWASSARSSSSASAASTPTTNKTPATAS